MTRTKLPKETSACTGCTKPHKGTCKVSCALMRRTTLCCRAAIRASTTRQITQFGSASGSAACSNPELQRMRQKPLSFLQPYLPTALYQPRLPNKTHFTMYLGLLQDLTLELSVCSGLKALSSSKQKTCQFLLKASAAQKHALCLPRYRAHQDAAVAKELLEIIIHLVLDCELFFRVHDKKKDSTVNTYAKRAKL